MLKTVHDIFSNRYYEIPLYQRGYAWERSNIDQLVEDIQEAVEAGVPHYIGTLVLFQPDKRKQTFQVVDGQQRLTSLTMLLCALINRLPTSERDFYHRTYILDGAFRLKPLNQDQAFFWALLDKKPLPIENKSQRLLSEGLNQIGIHLSSLKEPLELILAIRELQVMEFVQDNESDAIRIFQTVNDRGKPLSNMEKAKSLLIYHSNRYLHGRLDENINRQFGEMFAAYADIKETGEQLRINLISASTFNEDNIFRYHFLTFSDRNYDPTANFVLDHLRQTLTEFRRAGDMSHIEHFILNYVTKLNLFFQEMLGLITKAKTELRYYRLLVILELDTILFPFAIQLYKKNLLEKSVPQQPGFIVMDLLEEMDLKIYKTRRTDPKAGVAERTYLIDSYSLEEHCGWMRWYLNRFMSDEQYKFDLQNNVFRHPGLKYIFIRYSEFLQQRQINLEEIMELNDQMPNAEHILSQHPKFGVRSYGFASNEQFETAKHQIGNLTLLERSLNSAASNKSPEEKISVYSKSKHHGTQVLATIIKKEGFSRSQMELRTREIVNFCLDMWKSKITEIS